MCSRQALRRGGAGSGGDRAGCIDRNDHREGSYGFTEWQPLEPPSPS